MTTLRSTHQATAFPGSNAIAPLGSVGQVSNRQTEPFLRRKDDLHVTYWNVRTLKDVGVQALTMLELRKYNVNIACLSEVRIPDSGHSVIKVTGEEARYHIYHCEAVGNSGRHGLAIALSEAAQAALFAWVPISPRLASARLKGTTVNLTVIAVYAPTLGAAEEVKDSFYFAWFSNDGRTRNQIDHMLVRSLFRDRLPGLQWGSNRQ